MTKPPWTAPGATELTAFNAHGSGVDLFRAYIARRHADARTTKSRVRALVKRLEGGLPKSRYQAVASELVMLQILDLLDQIVADLVKACEQPALKDEALSQLREALRLGKGRAPANAAAAWVHWRAVQLWIAAFNEMRQPPYALKSDYTIARQIAAELGINWRTALRHWERFTDPNNGLPHQARWAKQIQRRARARSQK